jgi:hypothetical protein
MTSFIHAFTYNHYPIPVLYPELVNLSCLEVATDFVLFLSMVDCNGFVKMDYAFNLTRSHTNKTHT